MKPLRLLDSNFFIAILRRGGDPFNVLEDYVALFEFAVCGMVRMEVLRGIRQPKLLESVREGFSRLIWLPIRESTWDLSSEILKELEKTGRPIPVQDVVIAACAVEAGAAVVTHDTHFRRIDGLEVLAPPV